MKTDQKTWLDEFAVTCRVFKGRWSIRHCLRMCNEIDDLRIRMSSREKGGTRRHESAYNPCRGCKVMANYLAQRTDEPQSRDLTENTACNEVWAV